MKMQCSGGMVALVVVLMLATSAIEPAQAQTFKVLHSFTGGADGGDPHAGLMRDAKGDLYGTTMFGGGSGSCYGDPGCGVVFKLDKTGKETVLYTFTGTGGDGAFRGIPLGSFGPGRGGRRLRHNLRRREFKLRVWLWLRNGVQAG